MGIRIPVMSLLLRYVNNVVKKDGNYDIAQSMLNHYDEIPDLTIHELAEKCYCSASSLSRFIRLLGFENYATFREACMHVLDIDVDYSIELSKATKSDIKPIYERYTQHVHENLDYILSHMDYLKMDRICKMIYESKQFAFFGLEFAMLLGQHLQIKMAEMNKLVRIGNTYKEQKEIASALPEGSVVMIASLEGSYFIHNEEILDILKSKKIKIIALTMENHAIVERNSDEILLSSATNSNTEGRISLLYVIELIIMFYAINYQMHG